MKVKAKANGYFDNQIKRVGMIFKCTEREFSPTWMIALGGNGDALEVQPKKQKTEPMKEVYPVLNGSELNSESSEPNPPIIEAPKAPVAPVQPETNAGPSDLI